MNDLSIYKIKAGDINTGSNIISADALDAISVAIDQKQDKLTDEQLSAIDSINEISANADLANEKADEISASLSDYILKTDLSNALTNAGIYANTELSDITLGNCISALFELKNKLMS